MKEEFGLNLDKFKFYAGHSLGEYSALVASNSLDFEDAIFLLNARGKAMQKAVPVGKGGMIAVLGMNVGELKNLIKSNNEVIKSVCEIANDNAIGQVIVSGEKNSVNNLQIILKKNKIKSIPLKVSAPFHCSLMKPAAEEMQEKINSIRFLKPTKEI